MGCLTVERQGSPNERNSILNHNQYTFRAGGTFRGPLEGVVREGTTEEKEERTGP